MTSQVRFFADISVNFDYSFKRKHFEPGKFWDLLFPVVIFDPWNMYPPGETNGTFTVYRQKRGDEHSKQKNFEMLPVDSGVFLLSNTPCDQEIRVPGRWKNNVHFWRLGPYVPVLLHAQLINVFVHCCTYVLYLQQVPIDTVRKSGNKAEIYE